MKKKLGFLLLLICLGVATLGVLTVSAGTYGDLTYVISGEEAYIVECDKSATTVTIPETIKGYPVTKINLEAFYDCSSLTSVTIGNSVTFIGVYAFRDCSNLTSVTIPDSVTSIDGGAFYGCSNLTSVTIPDSVTSIGSSAFTNTAYYNDKNNWENGLLYIDNHLVDADTSITSATIKNSTKTIANNAFYRCSSLTSVTIPGGVISIGNFAFAGCSGLTSVTIPNSVTSIGSSAFSSYDYLIINCEKGSYALIYAVENDIPYNIVELSSPTVTGKAQRVNNKIVVYAEPSEMVTTQCLHVALYDSNNTMIDYIVVPNVKPFDHTNVVFKDNKDASYAKIFLWNSLSSLEPIADAYRVEIQ